ncbi:unnamed protein product, partial [Ranitomeya imitator]
VPQLRIKHVCKSIANFYILISSFCHSYFSWKKCVSASMMAMLEQYRKPGGNMLPGRSMLRCENKPQIFSSTRKKDDGIVLIGISLVTTSVWKTIPNSGNFWENAKKWILLTLSPNMTEGLK